MLATAVVASACTGNPGAALTTVSPSPSGTALMPSPPSSNAPSDTAAASSPAVGGDTSSATVTASAPVTTGTPTAGASPTIGASATAPGATGAGTALFGLKNTHSSPNSPISASTAPKLKLAWFHQTPAPVSQAPILSGGRVYTADWSGRAYALDAKTGKPIWAAQLEQPTMKWPWHGFAGGGVLADGKLYEVSVEGNAFALDAGTGKIVWASRVTKQKYAGNLAQLTVWDGKLYVGLSSVDEPLSKMSGFTPNSQGHVVALDAATGKTVWDQPLVKAPGNGVPVWGGFALDPSSGMLFTATGNNYTGSATANSDSIIALDAKTGSMKWSNQVYQDDVWVTAHPKGPDWDFGSAPQLFVGVINGKERMLVGAGTKGGQFFALDRSTGKAVWVSVIGYGSVGGGIRWDESIADGVIYASSNNNYLDKNPAKFPIDVKAVNAATGKLVWAKPKAQPAVGTSSGVLASDVYLVGSEDGTVHGYRAKDGKVVTSFQAPGPVSSSLVVEGGTLVMGTGIPAAFGGSPKGMGVALYQLPG